MATIVLLIALAIMWVTGHLPGPEAIPMWMVLTAEACDWVVFPIMAVALIYFAPEIDALRARRTK